MRCEWYIYVIFCSEDYITHIIFKIELNYKKHSLDKKFLYLLEYRM